MKTTQRRGGKPVSMGKQGTVYSRKHKKWVRREFQVDRERNRYTEFLLDFETGEILHRCDEPLDQHRGHGTAKLRP